MLYIDNRAKGWAHYDSLELVVAVLDKGNLPSAPPNERTPTREMVGEIEAANARHDTTPHSSDNERLESPARCTPRFVG